MSLSYPKFQEGDVETADTDFLISDLMNTIVEEKNHRILLLGSGGRESAMAYKIAQSKHTSSLFIAPGNGGTASYGANVPLLNPNDFEAVKSFIIEANITMLVCGPEEPLVKGLLDFLSEQPELENLLMVGPNGAGAQLEGSKDYSKAFMRQFNIPTAAYESFSPSARDDAEEFLDQLNPPFVLKADGLAAGKGVIICDEREEALLALDDLWSGKYSRSGEKVIIEEFLSGIECSVFVAVDGKDYKILPVAKDYKRIGEGDTGPNTGGMGSVSPVPFVDDAFMQKVTEQIIEPTVDGLRSTNIDYRGFIFIGLMNVDGDPYVIEYNCRMGDPETESVMLRIESDFVELLESIALQKLSTYKLKTSEQYAVSLMLVSDGYPGAYEKGKEITLTTKMSGAIVFHAGTQIKDDKLVTSGGRVLTISALADTLQEALDICYSNAKYVQYEGKSYRTDIGQDLLNTVPYEQ